MKNILIGCGVVILLFLVGFFILGFFIYRKYENFPKYAKREVVYKKYDSLLKRLDATIKKATPS